MHQYCEHMILDGVDLRLVMPIHGTVHGLSILYLCATQTDMYFPWKGVQWAGTRRVQLTWLTWSPLQYHGYNPSFNFAYLSRRNLRCPIPVGASLGPVYRSTILLRMT